MAKTHPLGFRVEPEIKEALVRVAKADGRSVSNTIERILAAWLEERGLLETKTPSTKAAKAKKRKAGF